MTNEPTDKRYAGQLSTVPMPEHPISGASGPSGPPFLSTCQVRIRPRPRAPRSRNE